MQLARSRRDFLLGGLGMATLTACGTDGGMPASEPSAEPKSPVAGDSTPSRTTVGEKALVNAPAWLPPVGVLKTLRRDDGTTSLMSSVDPCPGGGCAISGSGGQKAIYYAWNSAAYVEGLGARGSYVVAGGGHSDYFGNEIYAFDLDTRTWQRVTDPAPYTPVIGQTIFAPYYEYPAPYSSPAMPHTYDQFEQIPVSAAYPKGGIVLPVRAYVDRTASANCFHASFFDFQTRTWSRSTNDVGFASLDPTTTACYDAARNGYWWFGPRGNGRVSFLNLATKTWTPYLLSGITNWYFGYDVTSGYCPANGVVAIWDFYAGTSRTLLVFDPATRTLARPPVTGTAPDAVASMSWCPTLNRFYCYTGGGRRYVHTLTPPAANPLTGVWTWGTEQFALESDTPAAASGLNRRYNAFRWASKLEAFVWADGNNLGVQIYRPSGTAAPIPAGSTSSTSSSTTSSSTTSSSSTSSSSTSSSTTSSSGTSSTDSATTGTSSTSPTTSGSTSTSSGSTSTSSGSTSTSSGSTSSGSTSTTTTTSGGTPSDMTSDGWTTTDATSPRSPRNRFKKR